MSYTIATLAHETGAQPYEVAAWLNLPRFSQHDIVDDNLAALYLTEKEDA
jgi:hypothetical protein|nr:MAG TPA: hypothetical protein [Caudoviricetes sp.]